MAKLVETFQRLQKVETACLPKDDPAPVYLLDEILELARSSPEQAQGVADLVEKKLGHKSPIVKFKALRIIKHLCSKGCSTFQRCMQRHSGAVRELVHFKGEPDPFKGDVPNARVREFAKEVLEVLFNANPMATSGPATGSLAAQGRIQGFGSDGPGTCQPPPARSSYSSGYSGGMGVLSSAAASLSEGPLAAGVATVTSAINDFLGNPSARTGLTGSRYGNTSPQRNGGNGGYGGYGSFDSMGGSSSSAASAPAPHVSPAQVLGSEEGLVDDICAPGGLRPVPDASDLRRFVEAASAMDGLRLAEVLRAKMEGPGGWQVALRALCALEVVLQRGSSQACGEVAVMFQSDTMPLQALATSQQQLVRETAARCLRLLLGEDAAPVVIEAPAGKKGAKAYATTPPPAQDLLSLDDEAPAAAHAAPAAASAIDLLGDLAGPAPIPTAAAAAPAAAAGGDSLFSGLEVGAGTAQSAAGAASASSVGDMFGGLSLSPPTAAVLQPAAAPVAPAAAAPVAASAASSKKPAAPLDDLFSDMGTSSLAAPVQMQQHFAQQQPVQQQPWMQQQPPQHQQQQQAPWQQPAVVQMQPLGALGGALPAADATAKTAPAAAQQMGMGAPQHAGMMAMHASAHGRGLSGGGSTFSPNAAAAQQQPWSGGITKDHPAFDFVLDEFSKR